MISCTQCSWLWEYVNQLGFRPNTKTSFVVPSRLAWWRVECASSQNHRHTLCKWPMKQPTPDMLLLLGHIECMASLHSLMSESVGCSLGHLIVNHASPCGQRERVSALTLLPDAVNISDMNSNWRETRTLFRRRSAPPVYCTFTSTCMINWLPSLGNLRERSATTVYTQTWKASPIASSSMSGWLGGRTCDTIPIVIGTRGRAWCTEGSTMFAWTVLSSCDTRSAWEVYLPSQSAISQRFLQWWVTLYHWQYWILIYGLIVVPPFQTSWMKGWSWWEPWSQWLCHLCLKSVGNYRVSHNALHGIVITDFGGMCLYLSLCFLLSWQALHNLLWNG